MKSVRVPLWLLGIGAALGVGGACVVHADPIPAINRILPASIFSKSGSTATMRAATVSTGGYMTAVQASDLAFVLGGGLPTPTPAPTPTPVILDPLILDDGRIYSVGPAGGIAADTFAGANTASINGRALTTGAFAWTEAPLIGTNNIGITSNQAYVPTGLAQTAGAYFDSGISDGTIGLTIVTTNSTTCPTCSEFFLSFRGVSSLDFLYLKRDIGGCWFLDHTTNGRDNSSTHLGNDGCVTPYNDGDVVSVVYNGTSIVAQHNGASIITVTSAVNQTATLTGFSLVTESTTGPSPVVDNFTLDSVAQSPGIVVKGDHKILYTIPADTGTHEFSGAVVLDSSLHVAAGVSTLAAVTATTITASSTVQGTRLISTVPTGTAPATAASTTLVSNWNSDLLDGLDSSAFALASAPHYLTLVSTRNVTSTSANASPIVLGATMTPAACIAEVQSVGTGAGSCSYVLYDVTAGAALCTVSLACNSSSGTTGTCASSGSAASGHTIGLRETAPGGDTSSSFVVMTCSY